VISRFLSCLRRMLRIAHEGETINPVPKTRFITGPSPRKGFLLEGQFNELLELLPTHLRPPILFLYWCGVRKGEALQIQRSQVDLNTPLGWNRNRQKARMVVWYHYLAFSLPSCKK
jgi:integrase